MNLATIEKVLQVTNHPNADRLDIIKVLGYDAIVGRDQYKVGDLVVFIQPDSILPADQDWAQEFLRYTSRGRLRAVRLRGEWSMGLCFPLSKLNPHKSWYDEAVVGEDLTEVLGVTKYEPALPKNTQARGGLPYNLPRTDEERWQNLRDLDKLFGLECDVTLKIDGQSATFYAVPPHHPMNDSDETQVGLCSRSLELKRGTDVEGNPFSSNWHRAEQKYNILEKLKDYCERNRVSLALRGEVYGPGIQSFAHNPHSKATDIDFALYSVYNLDRNQYEAPTDQHYYTHVGMELGIPVVPTLESGELFPDTIQKYDNVMDKIGGDRYEGVVIKLENGRTFKVINKWYDSEKA